MARRRAFFAKKYGSWLVAYAVVRELTGAAGSNAGSVQAPGRCRILPADHGWGMN